MFNLTKVPFLPNRFGTNHLFIDLKEIFFGNFNNSENNTIHVELAKVIG
jgi:hypothetical protein